MKPRETAPLLEDVPYTPTFCFFGTASGCCKARRRSPNGIIGDDLR